jgi:hypothetical protein
MVGLMIRILVAIPLLVSLSGLPVFGVVCAFATAGTECCCRQDRDGTLGVSFGSDCGCRLAPAPFGLPSLPPATMTASTTVSGDGSPAVSNGSLLDTLFRQAAAAHREVAARSGVVDPSRSYLSGAGFRC